MFIRNITIFYKYTICVYKYKNDEKTMEVYITANFVKTEEIRWRKIFMHFILLHFITYCRKYV